MSRLDAVLFDLDDTLFSTTEFARNARRNACRAMVQAGLDCSEEAVMQELTEVVREFGSNYANHYDKLMMRLPPGAVDGLNPAVIVAAGMVAYHDTKFQELHPFWDVKPLLTSLRSSGLIVGVITHGWTTKQAEKLIRLKLLPLLSPTAIFISDQVGISKPNPKLYQTALRTLDLKAERVMYVGDNQVNDIAPPASLGMPTTWSRRAAKVREPLEGVKPDHVVDDFRQLGRILRDEYEVDLSDF